ncbi:uncharacterized protein B0T15DRAFT_485120 [Chaetomium strumarium]|uniref:Uncharacterized protein n=1 Tax=Chaetomium strumarium TaxID=1170767 RepID=A0AAJ0GSX5_9PEZI|nr:hypothetical protein B0T15DRAFT_485120 [Chaetomium strumarium]
MAVTDDGKLFQSISSQILGLPPSCVEFCPAFPSYFLVGTYSLEVQTQNAGAGNGDVDSGDERDGQPAEPAQPKQPQSRNGSIVAFQILDGAIIHVETVAQPSALLDLRFNPHDGCRDICAVVSSTATLALFRLCPDGDRPLMHLRTMGIAAMSRGEIGPSPGQEILFLSFAWHPTRADMMAITTSTGHVYLVHLPSFDGNWELSPEPVITHMLETWCVAISPFPAAPEPSVETAGSPGFSSRVYSGGDDSTLRCRICNWKEGDLTGSLPALESRGHGAGVTAILPLFKQEDGHEVIVTGSYDEHIRLFSVPPFGKPRGLAESSLGGGVWRLKLIDLGNKPNQDYTWKARILASCMHAGARIVELLRTADGEYQFKVVGRFEEHKSMNYGSDCQPGTKGELTIVSTSFYDKLLCLWRIPGPASTLAVGCQT